MKKLLSPKLLPLTVLGAGMVGMLLRLWYLLGGIDAAGLPIEGHIADILLTVLTVAVVAVIFLATWRLSQASKYSFNFPPSLAGCIGAIAAAVGAVWQAISVFPGGDWLSVITGVLGLLAAVCLVFLGLYRLKGLRPTVLFHFTVCLFFALCLILQYRQWSGVAMIQSYSYPLLATVCLMLSCYQDAMFAASTGARRTHAFFHLAALYFCCISLVGDHSPFLYLTASVWMFTDLCRLTPMPRQRHSRPNREETP